MLARWWLRGSPPLRAGITHIQGAPGLRQVAVAATLVMALSGAGVAAQYSLVHGIGQRPAFLGVLSALLGAGSIIAALSAGRLIGSLVIAHTGYAAVFVASAVVGLGIAGWLVGSR